MATIEARITKVEYDVGTEWYTILTDHETVKRLTTKIKQKAEEAATFKRSGEVTLIEYSAKQRHDESSGRTYNNHYYERAKTVAASSNGTDSGIDQIAPTTRKTDPSDAWRICLGAGAKLAVGTLPLMPPDQQDFETQKRIAIAWAQWIFTTPPPGQPESSFATTRAANAPGAYDEPGTSYDSPPPPSDDDIPF